mgnify:CR=1 FL=1
MSLYQNGHTRIVTGISVASLMVSVITLALVLILFVGKPWESTQVGLELGREILQEERGISEAQRLGTCKAIGDFVTSAATLIGFLTE